jgi:hypothetical protein
MRSCITNCLHLATLGLVVLISSAARGQGSAKTEDVSTASTNVAPSIAKVTTERNAKKLTPKVVIPFSREAYRVVVEIGFDGEAPRDPTLRQSCVDQIRKGLDRMYGAAWIADVRQSEWLIPGGREQLDRLTTDELLARYPESETHKVLMIGIEVNNGEYQISCREYDTRVQEMSPVLTVQTNDEQNVANVACRLVRDSFRPVLLFAGPSVAGGELEFLLQAGELSVPDPTAEFIREGDVLRPFLRQMDRRNPDKLKSLQRLDLCYVRVTGFSSELRADARSPDDVPVSVEGMTRDTSAVYYDSGHVRGALISHGPVPYGGAGRSVQQIALRQRPNSQSSVVKLVLHSRPDRPLICHRVDKIAKLRHTDKNETPGVRVLSDRNGKIKIDVDSENPTFWLYVYSGSSLLARVPYAPGIIPEDTIKLPDDSLRLGVEGELYLFRDALLDTVAQKAVLMSLAKKASAAGKLDELDKLILQLDDLPGQKDFMSRLNSIKTPAVNKADLQRNAGVKRKIEKLCLTMEESLAAFYSSDNRIRQAQEIEQLRQSAESKSDSIPGAVPSQ